MSEVNMNVSEVHEIQIDDSVPSGRTSPEKYFSWPLAGTGHVPPPDRHGRWMATYVLLDFSWPITIQQVLNKIAVAGFSQPCLVEAEQIAASIVGGRDQDISLVAICGSVHPLGEIPHSLTPQQRFRASGWGEWEYSPSPPPPPNTPVVECFKAYMGGFEHGPYRRQLTFMMDTYGLSSRLDTPLINQNRYLAIVGRGPMLG